MSEEYRLCLISYFFRKGPFGEILFLSIQVVHIAVWGKAYYETNSFRHINQHKKFSAPIFPDFKFVVSGLVWTIKACQKTPITSHRSVDLFVLHNVQDLRSTDHSYQNIHSSSSSCKPDSTLANLYVWHEQLIFWLVSSSPSICIWLVNRLYGLINDGSPQASARFLLQSIFSRNRRQNKAFQMLWGHEIRRVRLIESRPHPFCCFQGFLERNKSL